MLRKARRNGVNLDFELFQECLKELFFKAETLGTLDTDEESIGQSIGTPSLMARDTKLDDYYNWQAHHQLQTDNEAAFQKKFKSFRLPFRNEIRPEEGKLDAYSHETYD